jgi:hypothetical protein
MLTQEEDAYIEFLRLRNVSISEASLLPALPLTLSPSDVMQKLRGDALRTYLLFTSFLFVKADVVAAGEQLKDRDSFDKAQRAYVSYVRSLSHPRCRNDLSMYVRAYKEHQCSFIFQLKQLDYGALANQVAHHSVTRTPPHSSSVNVEIAH